MVLQIPPNCDLTLGLSCRDKTTPGLSIWTMRVDERFLNPAGTVQGGFLCAMADSAMGAAAVSAAGDRKILVANTEMKVSFLRRVHEGAHLTCTARVLKAGKLITFVVAHITDEHEHLVASASSTYLIKDRTE